MRPPYFNHRRYWTSIDWKLLWIIYQIIEIRALGILFLFERSEKRLFSITFSFQSKIIMNFREGYTVKRWKLEIYLIFFLVSIIV